MLVRADLTKANLKGADLTGASLCEAADELHISSMPGWAVQT